MQFYLLSIKILLSRLVPLVLNHMFPFCKTNTIKGRTLIKEQFIFFVSQYHSNMIYWLNYKYHINCSGKSVAVWLHYAQIWTVWCRQYLLAFKIPCSKCMASCKTQEFYRPIHFQVIFHLNDESLILCLLSIH